MLTTTVFYGVEREVPLQALYFARNLIGHDRVASLRALRTRFDLDLAGACGCLDEAARRESAHQFLGRVDVRDWWTPSPMHGDGWYYCADNFGGLEDHWVTLPLEQFTGRMLDKLFC